jgi:hypothetical protein
MGIYLLILTIVSIIVIALGAMTPLLRDTVVNPQKFLENAALRKIENPKAPFSLARTQLAFWTVIIFSSFLDLLLQYKNTPGINNVNLILLGIAAGTTATAKVIDDSQKTNPDLSQDYPSEGFIRDILSDKNGVSIHRLQNVLWTLVVGFIYIRFVAIQSSLPDDTILTNNLLILMGISTGTYVGLKTTENMK